MSSRRPPRAPGGGGSRGFTPPSSGPADSAPAQTALGELLQRALAAAQQAEAPEQAQPRERVEVEQARDTKLCANCWNALTFKNEQGQMMARCSLDLWVKPAFTVDDLNKNKIRRWYADCPMYDDSE